MFILLIKFIFKLQKKQPSIKSINFFFLYFSSMNKNVIQLII
jgi:hypothetical protein